MQHPDSTKRTAHRKGEGIRLYEFPGNRPGKYNRAGSKKHCGVCGGCTESKCWKKSFEHANCLRHLAAG